MDVPLGSCAKVRELLELLDVIETTEFDSLQEKLDEELITSYLICAVDIRLNNSSPVCVCT